MKRRNECISYSPMVTEDVAKIIIPCYVITGKDHTSGLFGHDKAKLLQKLISDPEPRELLGRVGNSLELCDEVKCTMKTFVLQKSIIKTQVLPVGRQGHPNGIK